MNMVRPLASSTRHAHHPAARRRVDHPQHLVQRLVEVAGDAGDHAVGVAQRHHGGGEGVAVLVDQPLHVAVQIALALQALVEEVDVLRIAVRQAGVDDLELASAGSMPGLAHVLAHQLLAAAQDGACPAPGSGRRRRRGSPPAPRPRRRRCACGSALHLARDLLQEGGRRIEPLGQARRDRRPCPRSACAPRRCPSPPGRRTGGMYQIRRGSNGVGMMYSGPNFSWRP